MEHKSFFHSDACCLLHAEAHDLAVHVTAFALDARAGVEERMGERGVEVEVMLVHEVRHIARVNDDVERDLLHGLGVLE